MKSSRLAGEPVDLLLIEDNPGDARLFDAALEDGQQLDAVTRWERSLEGGLEAARGTRPDLLVLDLGLPDSEGLEGVRRMTGEFPNVPVVVLTGRDDPELGESAVREGAQDYLVKGDVTSGALTHTLRFALLRSRADAEMRRRETRFGALLANVSGVISVVGPDGTVLYQSPSARRVLGYEPEELEGENILEYFHPEDRQRLQGELAEMATAPDEEKVGEARFRHADGSWRVLESRGRMPPEDSDLNGVIIVSRDVTERVERERALAERVKEQSCLYDVSRLLHADERELERRLQDVVERLPDGWQYPEVTAARIRLEGQTWTSSTFPDDSPSLTSSISASGQQVGSVEVCYLEDRPDEDIGPFISEERQLLEAIAEQIGIAVDRRATHRELETERSRLEDVFRQAPSWIGIMEGPEHVFARANPAYRELVGGREIIGRPARDVFPELEGEGFIELLDRVYETGERVTGQERPLRLETDEGVEQKYITFVYEPRREDGETTGVIAHGVDVTEQVEKREEAEERKAKLDRVLETTTDGILLTDAEGNFIFANPAAEELLGLERLEIKARAYSDPKWELRGPDGGEFPDEEFPIARVLRTEDSLNGVEFSVIHPDGTRRVLSGNHAPMMGPEGELQGVVASLRDITVEKRAQEALRESEERFRQMAENIDEVFWLRDPRSEEVLYLSPAFEGVTGRPVEPVYRDPTRWMSYVHPMDRDRVGAAVLEDHSSSFEFEYRLVRPDGEIRWIRDQGFPVTNEEGEVYRVAGVARDVTEQKRLEEQLRYRALHDPLTGLANRTLLMDRVEQGLARSQRSGQPLGLLMLDVLRFKRINDRLGHAAGDRVLEALARRLQEEVRDEDTVARWGGDEFVVVVPELEGPEAIRTVHERIRRAVERPVEVMGESIHLDLRAGGVLYGEDEHPQMVQTGDSEELVRFGDLALHRAKERPTADFHLFDPDEEREGVAHFRHEQELRRGLEADEFVPHYQPIVRLEDGELVGLEALARWDHPERGIVNPGEFIPLTEELGLIGDLGEVVLRRGGREAANWARENGAAPPAVSFNLSGQQFEDSEVADRLREVVEEAGLSPEEVILEVTETVIMQEPARIDQLRALGFRVYVDDFGTGYSTFAYLRDLSLDGLKIDMSFVQRMTESRTDAALVETMLNLGKTLGLRVVAEGVETEEQRVLLCEMGCELGQGYLFARPMPGGDVPTLLV